MKTTDEILPREDIEVVAEHYLDGVRVVILAVCYPGEPGVGHYEMHAGGVWIDQPFFAEPTVDEIRAALAARP